MQPNSLYGEKKAPSAEQQRLIASQLRRYFAAIDEKTRGIPESEQEEIIEEALTWGRDVSSQKRTK